MKRNYYPIIIVLVVLLIAGIFAIKFYASENKAKSEEMVEKTNTVAPTVAMKNSQDSTSIKGTKLAENEMLKSHYYLVYPVTGTLPKETQTALSGWKITNTKNTDGSMHVIFTPNNTEQEDHKQEFDVKTGEKLYFVELNLNDDINGEDKMWIDDVGILTDANDVILNDLPKLPQKPPQQ